jgi:hypothetical protein
MALFHDPVRVPEEAGEGKAKVTLSFPDWEGAKVAPATIDVPIQSPEPAEESRPR